MVKTVVCVKEIPDPDIAASVFAVDEAARRVVPLPGLPPVASPFDEQAIELALRLRERSGTGTVTLLTLGAESARAIVKRGLALGADDAVLLVDPAFDDGDAYTTARALAAAISRMGAVDLVLAGRQAADTDGGIVGCGIAELLGLPAITLAADVNVDGDRLVVERALPDGGETVDAPLPAVVTVSHEVGAIRYPSLRETMKAARKPVALWTVADLGLDPADVGVRGARRVLERLHVPVSEVICEFVAGADAHETAANLADRLERAGLLRGVDAAATS